jgi:hypothetical protein
VIEEDPAATLVLEYLPNILAREMDIRVKFEPGDLPNVDILTLL